MRAEVIVVGLGTMGSAALETLSRRGLRVLGVDRWAPPHERGSHGGGSRIIRLAYTEGPAYVPLLHRAYELWEDLQQRSGRQLLVRTGALTIGHPDGGLVCGVLDSAARHDLDCRVVGLDEYPQFHRADDEIAVLDAAGGVLAPDLAITACLDLAGQAGAELRTDLLVTGWSADPTGVTVHTTEGDLEADRLVLCAGAGAPALLADLGVPWRVERRVQQYWRPADPAPFAPERFPVWMWEGPDGSTAYGLPWQDRPGGVKAAMHEGGEDADIELGAAPATAGEVALMREWLGPRLPDLAAGEWVGDAPCLYTLTPDEHFVLGHHPAHPRVVIAAGFSGHGFKFLPVVGEILADLTETGTTRHPIALFAPSRFTP